MNRVIRFRGKTLKAHTVEGKTIPAGTWIYGYYYKYHNNHRIIMEAYLQSQISLDVAPNTVGQFTGLLDSKGNEIYEGDVLQKEDVIWATTWNKDDCGFIVEQPSYGCNGRTWYWLGFGNNKTLTVIGNIYDNPNLIKRK